MVVEWCGRAGMKWKEDGGGRICVPRLPESSFVCLAPRLVANRVHNNFVFTVPNFIFLTKFDFYIFEFETEITHFPNRNSLPGVVRKRKISPKFGEIPPKL